MIRVTPLHARLQAIQVETPPERDELLVVTPRDELTLGPLGREAERLDRDRPGRRLTHRGVVLEHLEELADDVLLNDVRVHGGRRGTLADGVLAAAPVAGGGGVPAIVAAAHDVPAARAAEDPSEQRSRATRRRVAAHPGGGERGHVDERLVRAGGRDDATLAARLTEVDAVREYLRDGLTDPCAAVAGADAAVVQHLGDHLHRDAVGSHLERVEDRRRDERILLKLRPFALALVADGDARGDVDASVDGPLLRDSPVFFDPGVLELGEREHDLQREPADRRRRVELVVHADELAARLLDPSDRLEGAGERAGEPVELRDDDAVALSALDPLDRLIQDEPVGAAAGDVKLDERLADLMAMQTRPALTLLTLNVGADERLALAVPDAADSDQKVEFQGALFIPPSDVAAEGILAEEDEPRLWLERRAA